MENSIRLKRVGETLILDLIGNRIDTIEFDVHLKHIKKYKNFTKLYVNLAYLNEIDNDIIRKFHKMRTVLNDKNICLININAVHNCILNIFKIDKMFQLYMTKQDAIEGQNPLINRQFKLVS